ncbi:MAG: thioredoxin [Tannerellaceae bacterium]|jgi:thioredoxin 1|nr:thioredoxin [Tannerellaceae bacterium]
MTLEVTDSNFEELLAADKPLVVDFWAEWCGPCRMIGPIVEKLAQQYEGRVTIGKMDIEANPETVERFGIRTIPTLLFFRNGEAVDKVVGAVQESVLDKKIDALLI